MMLSLGPAVLFIYFIVFSTGDQPHSQTVYIGCIEDEKLLCNMIYMSFYIFNANWWTKEHGEPGQQ